MKTPASNIIERKQRVTFTFKGHDFECDVREVNSSGVRAFNVIVWVNAYVIDTWFYQLGRADTDRGLFYSTAYRIDRPPYMFKLGQPTAYNTAEKLFARLIRHIAHCIERS